MSISRLRCWESMANGINGVDDLAEDYEISQEDFDEIDAIGRANQVRGNIPYVYSPQWNIDVFGTPEEKAASGKVW